jgi:hypothetical protein
MRLINRLRIARRLWALYLRAGWDPITAAFKAWSVTC